jgi:hypothetical protein
MDGLRSISNVNLFYRIVQQTQLVVVAPLLPAEAVRIVAPVAILRRCSLEKKMK